MSPPSRSTHRSWLQILLTVTVLAGGILAIECPVNCKCSWVLDSLVVDCARRGLVACPDLEKLPIDQLNLASNHFVTFPSQLSSIESLTYLDLSNNQIEFIEQNALKGFLSLRTLILANNSIQGWQSINPNTAFTHAPSLKVLVLSWNKLYSFTDENPSLALVSESLNVLELKGCSISAASGDVIWNGLPNLDRLVLSNNALYSLVSLPSRSLRVLELSSCGLPNVDSLLLEGLPNLESLDLSWNPSLTLGSKSNGTIFSGSLNELDVSFCNLDVIDLSGLPLLAKLRLRGNMLRFLLSSTFFNNTLLEVLDLGHNSLRLVDAKSFSNLKRLTNLDLSYNEIARLDRNLFRTNEALAVLNLSRNVLESFTKIVSNSLRQIDLSWCEIISIDGAAFSGLSAIQSLDLSNNLIREFPGGMRSETLRKLNLSNCRLSTLRNTTFHGFPELASLWLNGNRFTNPFPSEYFRSNKYLDRIWIGDNPWICNCHDETFADFYDFLTSEPQKLMDKDVTRCASPSSHYGRTWQTACLSVWVTHGQSSTAEKLWLTIVMCFVIVGSFYFVYTCFMKVVKSRRHRRNRSEYERNQEEMQSIRRQNARILREEGAPNAPNPYEANLPSYEDALLMPKLERPVKSMVDLTASSRARKKPQRLRTNPQEYIASSRGEEEEAELIIDNCHRFRSEEMLTNRAKERMAPVGTFRRTGRIDHNNSGSRRFSIEDSRFASSHLKSQNLQSAEKIANFQSYENSPYTKRRPMIAEIPPFKRASLKAESVEFLTDPEFAASSKPNSPFARRRPKTTAPQSQGTPTSLHKGSTDEFKVNIDASLGPTIDDYFGHVQPQSPSNSTDGSDFQLVIGAEVASMPDDADSSSDVGKGVELGRRKKRRNSSSRRASGNFNAAEKDSSSSDPEATALVHKPMKETLF